MRILAGLTVAAALVALSGVPAIAECNWGKIAQSKPQTSVARQPGHRFERDRDE